MRGLIFVTNHNDFTHTDAYDGEEFIFPPKERVALSVDAASHMFGFNNPDKDDTLTRLGWAWKYDTVERKFVEDPTGAQKLARFVFTKAVMVEAPVDAPDPEPVGLADMPEVRRPKGAIDFLTTPESPLV